MWRLNIPVTFFSYMPSVRSLPEATQKAKTRHLFLPFTHDIAGGSNHWKHGGAKCWLHCVDYNCFGAINSNLTFISDLQYFLWKLKTSKRQGVSSLLETKHKVFRFKTKKFLILCQSKTLKVASKFLSSILNFQSHWRPVGRNFGAPKNMGGLCFQVPGS